MPETRFGYLLPTRDQALAGEHDLKALARYARRAEALGYDSVWAGDSPISRPRADPLIVLAAAAETTGRVALGTAVLLAALRHPVLLGHQLAGLDRLSDGRLVAGMGAGFPSPATEAEFGAIGVTFKRRVSRLEESVAVMRRLWAGGPVTHSGDHFAFADVAVAPPPARPGGPPVWLAGGGEPALRRVARIADGWLPYPPEPGVYAAERRVIEQNTDRPVTPALYLTLCLDADPERARRRLRAFIENYYDAPLEAIGAIQAMFAGTPEDAAAWLNGYVAAGARHIVVRFATGDHESALEEFAGRVRPLVDGEARS
ncbi:LLM class flavin-dependent oxidoreductase [Actinomadura verrucosospora]|uniref:F420-dependent N5 N10-methylene tetrahydromethanopterin reductase n=1 Tax=Actinomadura verrucosospora TaxID=46165 RepID=A0A7D4AQC8_ACTVE|nr:LLM class flavin-dependent oxidoreductase [Actinomadura verrucosospora]QKG22589.1 F420-dependent N5 N10-methylene tetrahydromethanopterin reductase [Actinomadura verrucosospora]